jgi:signal peptidase I
LEYRDSVVYLAGKPIESYIFMKNYCFVAGDRAEDSQDSRYRGLFPEEYIVGKACLVWKSADPYTGKFRWERFLRIIR